MDPLSSGLSLFTVAKGQQNELAFVGFHMEVTRHLASHMDMPVLKHNSPIHTEREELETLGGRAFQYLNRELEFDLEGIRGPDKVWKLERYS
jgi:hypothetical protein